MFPSFKEPPNICSDILGFCMFVTLGLEICSQCGFLAMAVAKDTDMELVVWKRVW